jgi:hypothetical protein
MKQKIIQILFLIALAAVAVFYVTHHKVAQAPANDQPADPTKPKTYFSDKLGISFQYLPDQDADGKADSAVWEENDKIYVYYSAMDPKQGQWVQEFKKDAGDTLAQAVQKQFLKDVSATDCFVKDFNQFYSEYGAPTADLPANVEKALIAYPIDVNSEAPFWQNSDKCPKDYSLSNGISYFYMDKNHPDKFFFFSIGQYGILADTEKNLTWQDTFQVK